MPKKKTSGRAKASAGGGATMSPFTWQGSSDMSVIRDSGIESRPGVAGGDPCIVRTRIPVWLLEQARRLGTSEAELLTCYPVLHAEDLANAWTYVRGHREETERQIAENENDES